MAKQTLIPVEAEPTAVATVQRDTSPEAMLMLAIERNVSAESLEKLVMLQERIQKQRAEAAFNAAMAAFSEECPPILKNREAFDTVKNKHMYDFADLPQVMRVIDPVLHRHGLSYTFDCDMAGDQVTVTCHVHHIEGHSRASKFTCLATGTSIMSQPQKAASATTFGRRYALQCALGLCIDNDMDAGDLAPPPEGPRADPTKPQTQPRGERVTADDIRKLFDAYKAKIISLGREPSPDGLQAWAVSIGRVPAESFNKASAWSQTALNDCYRDLGVSRD